MEKETKAAVDYRRGSAARHCSICRAWRPPHGCVKVEGAIDASMLCDRFVRQTSVAANVSEMMRRK